MRLRFSAYLLLCLLVQAGCGKRPQPVRHLHEPQQEDTVLAAQLRFNLHMADAADKLCIEMVQQDSLRYALDDFGFWYAKSVVSGGDTLQNGQEVELHLVLSELRGGVIADEKGLFVVGESELPVAINRSLRQMCAGEEMRIVAPWYAAYGIEGTTLIAPYTNLRIQMKVIQ